MTDISPSERRMAELETSLRWIGRIGESSETLENDARQNVNVCETTRRMFLVCS